MPVGIKRIEAVVADSVVNTAGLPLERQVVVGVMDSGIDATHPDINYFGGRAWNAPNSNFANDGSADVDNHGHGTHVAGIIGARNTGAGVVGVAPGVPLFSLKVLDGSGKGALSNVLAAVSWVVSHGKAQGIKVLNLSLAAFVDPSSEDYADTLNTMCSVFKEASDAGVLVIAAAGNYGSDVQGFIPAACPTVAVVTAVDSAGSSPASFSNFLAATASDADKARVIAAPGVNIMSTTPYARDASGYKQMSGTSQASPHVAGIAATCMMSGACDSSSTGVQHLATLQAAAQERYSKTPTYNFSGDATSTARNKYYGYMAYAKY